MPDRHAGPRLRGRRQECEALDRLLARSVPATARCWCCAARPGSARPRCWTTSRGGRPGAGSHGRRASSPRWSWRSPGCTSCARRCSTAWRGCRSRSGTRSARRSACGAGRRPTGSSSAWRCSGCCPRRRPSEPLVCLVDDAQWLDRASAQVLAFAARRLLAESVALVFVVREPSDERDLEGLPELVVRGLRDGDARALLDSRDPGPARRRGCVTGSSPRPDGNPLALLELPRGVDARGAGRAASGVPTRGRWRAASSRASCGGSSRCRRRRSRSCSRRRPSRSAT